MKKKIIYLALFILFTSAMNSYAAPLKVEISVDQSSIKNDDYFGKPYMFSVLYKIKNTSDTNQEITLWTGCSGWSWTSNRSEIIPGAYACLQNTSYRITLKPNEEHNDILGVSFSAKLKKTGPLTFRLGFYPHTGVGEIKTEADIKETIWSNDVTITIEPWMLQNDILK